MAPTTQSERSAALIRIGSRRLAERGEAARTLICIAITGSVRPPENAILPLSFQLTEPTRAEPQITFLLGRSGSAQPVAISLDEVRDTAEHDALLRALVVERAFGVAGTERTPRQGLYAPKIVSGALIQVPHARVTTVASSVQERIQTDGLDVTFLGHSASGKTVAAAQVGVALERMGWRVVWFDMADPSCDACDLACALAGTSAGTSRRALVIVDDIQANPTEFRRLGGLLPHLRRGAAVALGFLVIGWETARSLAAEVLPDGVIIPCHGDRIISEVLANDRRFEQDTDLLDELRRRCRGNVLLATLGADIASRVGRLPSDHELAEAAWKGLIQSASLSSDMFRILYRISSLSQLQIDVARAFVDVASPEAMRDLYRTRMLRINGDFVSLGHASMAALVLRHLKRAYPEHVSDLPAPPRVAVDYLRNAGDRQIAVTLERLDLARLAEDPLDQHGTAILARAWESFHILLRLIELQVRDDPSWGDNLASAVFAATALAEVRHGLWDSAAQFIRSRWEVPDDGRLPKSRQQVTKERIDFDEIKKAMLAEEATHPHLQRADTIDLDRFHRTWVLGLLLEFEGTARHPDPSMIERLKRAAALAQLPDGAFYPSRVPWVTARVILGLVAAGESMGTSEVVRKACDWLRRPAPLGPFSLALWESGTGQWNSPELTSALCIQALVRAGISPVEQDVAAAHSFVLAKRAEWTEPGKEIDTACAMQTYMLVRRNWREVSSELDQLLAWARDQAAWADPAQTASDLHTESSKATFVANALIGIVWGIVTAELPLLIEQLAPPDFDLQEEPPQSVRCSWRATVRDALNELRASIQQAILSRETIAPALGITPGPEVTTAIARWNEHRATCLALQETFETLAHHGDSPDDDQRDVSALMERIDELGRQCKGDAWVQVKARG